MKRKGFGLHIRNWACDLSNNKLNNIQINTYAIGKNRNYNNIKLRERENEKHNEKKKKKKQIWWTPWKLCERARYQPRSKIAVCKVISCFTLSRLFAHNKTIPKRLLSHSLVRSSASYACVRLFHSHTEFTWTVVCFRARIGIEHRIVVFFLSLFITLSWTFWEPHVQNNNQVSCIRYLIWFHSFWFRGMMVRLLITVRPFFYCMLVANVPITINHGMIIIPISYWSKTKRIYLHTKKMISLSDKQK